MRGVNQGVMDQDNTVHLFSTDDMDSVLKYRRRALMLTLSSVAVITVWVLSKILIFFRTVVVTAD